MLLRNIFLFYIICSIVTWEMKKGNTAASDYVSVMKRK